MTALFKRYGQAIITESYSLTTGSIELPETFFVWYCSLFEALPNQDILQRAFFRFFREVVIH